MSQPRFAVLRADIAREMESVRRSVAEAGEWGSRLADWPETVRVRTTGGILHDFYCGVERVFRHIALRIDDDLPGGPDWHVQLLQRMGTTIDSVRPAVIDHETARQLDEYLRFRHLFRNTNGFDLDWERCRDLLAELPATYARLAQALAAFDGFLKGQEEEL